mgnify:CR=1 FL=1
MNDLSQGMDTGICSAGGMNSYMFPTDDGESLFDLVLNGLSSGLRLPALETASVISESECEPGHIYFSKGTCRRVSSSDSWAALSACT